MNKTKILCVLDGLGLTTNKQNNAVYLAKLPVIRSLFQKYNWLTLNADGDSVGQEKGLVGNSEVGHMNIGGLQLVPQLSYQITKSSQHAFDMSDQQPAQNFDPKELLNNAYEQGSNKVVHLLGLFSQGTIHSDLRHWAGAIEAAGKSGAEKIILHIISDGRDSDPKSLLETWDSFVEHFGSRIENYKGRLYFGSIGGRYYGMDRDQNWDRVHSHISALFNWYTLYEHEFNGNLSASESKYIDYIKTTFGIEPKLLSGTTSEYNTVLFDSDNYNGLESVRSGLVDIVDTAYAQTTFDETIQPSSLVYQGLGEKPEFLLNGINKKDVVWFLNYRTDRFRQLTRMVCSLNSEFNLELMILALNDYGVEEYKSITQLSQIQQSYYAIFSNKPVVGTLSEYITSASKTQLHIAETEKYNHVTYFFNGGQDRQEIGEDWVLVNSNKVQSHAQKPEMKAKEITDTIIASLHSSIELISCTEEDVDQIKVHIKDFWVEVGHRWHSSTQTDSRLIDTTLSSVYGELLPKNCREGNVYFVFFNGQKAGIVHTGIYPDTSELFVFDLYIFPQFRSKGVGTHVLKYMRLLAHSKKCSTIGLWVDEANVGAKTLYNRLGFSLFENRQLEYYDEFGSVVQSRPALYLRCDILGEIDYPDTVKHYDYIVVNYANPDMVAHTGDLDATVTSLEFLDAQLGRLVEAAELGQCDIIITADHGNAESVGELHSNHDHGEVDTKHNDNPVPCIFVTNESKGDPQIWCDGVVKKLKDTSLNQKTAVDLPLLTNQLQKDKKVDITNQEQWFDEHTDLSPSLSLWYAGLLLLIL